MNVKKWRSLEAVKKKIATMISDLHQSLISVNLIEAKDKISLDLSIDHAALTSHVRTLGKSYLISNHPSKSAEEIVQLFRQQITVEQVFSYLKSPISYVHARFLLKPNLLFVGISFHVS